MSAPDEWAARALRAAQRGERGGRDEAADALSMEMAESPETPRRTIEPWEVYGANGRYVATVYYAPGADAQKVKNALVNSFGYPSNITVKRGC